MRNAVRAGGRGAWRAATCGLLATLMLAVGLVGCSPAPSSSDSAASGSGASQPEASVASVTVTAPGDDGRTVYAGSVEVAQGMTVLDALQATGLDVMVADSEYGAFVESVDGLANEGMKGWTYTVNGEMVQSSADKAEVAPGDAVEWSYIDMSA